jgi:hypothetical protein
VPLCGCHAQVLDGREVGASAGTSNGASFASGASELAASSTRSHVVTYAIPSAR